VIAALRGFGRFWYDFVVGDDWRIAVGIVVLLVAGALLVRGSVVRTDAIAVGLPVLLVGLVAASILRDARRA
jgi:hypothetical protein